MALIAATYQRTLWAWDFGKKPQTLQVNEARVVSMEPGSPQTLTKRPAWMGKTSLPILGLTLTVPEPALSDNQTAP